MFQNLEGLTGPEQERIARLAARFDRDGWTASLSLTCRRISEDSGFDLLVEKEGSVCAISYRRPVHLFRSLGLLREHAAEAAFSVREKMYIPEIGVMIDASRNSVPTEDTLYKLLDHMAMMGLNRLILYMEDVYELEGEPRFGYMRGGYTSEQLRRLDDYADGYGIRIVASIQVLGHLEKVLRFPEYQALRDDAACLLPGQEGTLALIGKMFSALSACLRHPLVIVGMDETEGLGRGRSRALYPSAAPLDLYLSHLNDVEALARRYGLQIAFYSDMLFKYSSVSHAYLDPEITPDPDLLARIPGDARLIYWDYYSQNEELLSRMLRKHQELGQTVYAGPLLSVSSFCVQYPATFRTAAPALAAVKAHGIPMAYGCLWHDDGAECSDFLGLLGMQYYAEQAYHRDAPSAAALACRFHACTGLRAKWFLDASRLDAVPCVNPDNRWPPNPSKYILWQDPLEGLYDADLRGLGLEKHYHDTAAALRSDLAEAGEDGWFLQVPCALAEVLESKSALGGSLAWDYRCGDKKALARDVSRLTALLTAVKNLHALHRAQWMQTCSPFGWARLDLRYGGLEARLETAEKRLRDYLAGTLPAIPELAEARYPSDRVGDLLGNGIWKTYDRIATLSDG